ncbi:MAG: hypothetical protein AB1578_01935 [Thermodesulfobacteriota bacterium]|jgi:hypothetical protein
MIAYRGLLTIALTAAALWTVAGCAAATPGSPSLGMRDPATGEPAGRAIRQVSVDGYRLDYYLLDPADSGIAGKARVPARHLMLYVAGRDGSTVEDAAVTFAIAEPSGGSSRVHAYYTKGRRVIRALSPRERPADAVAMEGGYGADLNLGVRGAHRISTEVAMGSVILRDEFVHTVE